MQALTLPEIDAMDDTMRAEPMQAARVKPLVIWPQVPLTMPANLSAAELRVKRYSDEADTYAQRMTQGLDSTLSQRRTIAHNYLIGMLSRAYINAADDLADRVPKFSPDLIYVEVECADMMDRHGMRAKLICGCERDDPDHRNAEPGPLRLVEAWLNGAEIASTLRQSVCDDLSSECQSQYELAGEVAK